MRGGPGLAVGAALLIALLAWLQFRGPANVPTAAIYAGILFVGGLCLISLEVAALVLIALTPFSIETLVASGTALQLPTEPILFLLLTVWILRSLARGTTVWRYSEIVAALLLALLSCLAGLPGSINAFHTLKATLNAAAYALFGLFVLNNFASRRQLTVLVVTWLTAGSLLTLYSLGCVAMGHYVKWMGYWWGLPFFVDHGTFSAYLSFTCAMALAITIESAGSLRIVAALVGFITGSQVVLSMTRGAWFGLAALALFLMVVSGRRLLRAGNVALISLALAGLVSIILFSGVLLDFEKHTSTLTDTNYVSNLERVNRWFAGVKMFRSSPLVGVGYGTYADNYRANRRISLSTDQSDQRMGVHSEYLRILAETGIAGLAMAGLTLFLLGRLFRRILRSNPDPFLRALAVGAAGGLVTYLVHGLVNNYVEYDKAAVPIWTAIGILGAIGTVMERESRPGDATAP